MLADFVTGLALIAVGGFLFILALPSHRRRRRRVRDPQINELRRQLRYAFTVVAMGAGLLAAGFGIIVIIISLAGFPIGLV
jgi:hypothetical protein